MSLQELQGCIERIPHPSPLTQRYMNLAAVNAGFCRWCAPTTPQHVYTDLPNMMGEAHTVDGRNSAAVNS